MFTHYRTLAFILKKSDQGEVNQLLAVYTKDFGRLEILARAIKKISSKLRSSVELFYLSEIEFIQGKSYKILTDAILINNFENIKKSLAKLALAFKISDVLDSLIKGQEPDEKIWQLLKETFEKLNNWQTARPLRLARQSRLENSLKIVYHYFLWNLFSLLGYQIELYCCLVCQKKLTQEKIFLDLKNKGLACSFCATAKKNLISPETIKIIRLLLKKDWATLERLKLEDKNLESLELVSRHYFAGILK